MSLFFSKMGMTRRPYFLPAAKSTTPCGRKRLAAIQEKSSGRREFGISPSPPKNRAAAVQVAVLLFAPCRSGGADPFDAPPPVPNKYDPNPIFFLGDGFGSFVISEKFEDTHFRNGVVRHPGSKPGGTKKAKPAKDREDNHENRQQLWIQYGRVPRGAAASGQQHDLPRPHRRGERGSGRPLPAVGAGRLIYNDPPA